MNKIDKELVRRRFARHLAAYDALATVQRRLAAEVAADLAAHTPAAVGRALEVGAGTGFLTTELLKTRRVGTLYLNDLVAEALPPLARRLAPQAVELLPGDAERIDLPAGLDWVASASTVQWFDDLPAFLERVATALAPGGVLAFNTFGPRNLHQVKALTGVGLDYLSEEALRAALERRFEPVAWRRHTVQQTFRSPTEVLRHLQQTGVTATGPFRWTPGALRAFERDYAARYGDGARVPLDWDVIRVVARLRT